MSSITLLDRAKRLQDLLIGQATGVEGTDAEYVPLRRELLDHPRTKTRVPDCVRKCRDLTQFWQFIKPKFATYAERRQFIYAQFSELLDAVESQRDELIVHSDQKLLAKLSSEVVQTVWSRALDRRDSDPEGAITSARALLETVCKHILDDLEIAYEEAADLPKLYRLTAEGLQIAPSQHTELVFKQILGGCTAVIEGLGALRNRLGDAHGGGRRQVRPAARHAQLAVNLAGSMTAFLVATWESRQITK
jgi:hypothetical protein